MGSEPCYVHQGQVSSRSTQDSSEKCSQSMGFRVVLSEY